MATEIILRTSFTPPVRLSLLSVLGGKGGAKAEDGSPLGLSDTALRVLRPSIELAGVGAVAPWGEPGDWRLPLAVLIGLVGLGAWGAVKLISR